MTDSNQTRRARRKAAAGVLPVRHGRSKRPVARRSVLSVIGIVLSVLLVSGGSLAAIAVWDLANSAKTVSLGDKVPTIDAIEGGFNVMLVGSDTRDGQSNNYGENPGSSLNDVNMIIHVSKDHKNVTVVSIPRDMVVPIAECDGGGGGWTGPINAVLSDGGLPCVVKTVEELTGLDIPYAGLVTFDAVVGLSKAVGGVRVCVSDNIDDPFTGLKLSKGSHVVMGFAALAFLRTRHGVGDGSDLGRVSNQQSFLSALMRKIKSDGLLSNPLTLYTVAKVMVSNMTLSTSLNSPDVLVSMAMALKNIDLKNIVFVQYPGSLGGKGVYAQKVQPIESSARTLFDALIADKPVVVTGGLGRGAEENPTPVTKPTATPTPKPTSSAHPTSTPTPTEAPIALDSEITGQAADQNTCAKAN
jgi:LCP family protein required for cell wall assembly